MIRAGITGGIGSGKSLVCSILKRLGAVIYDADTASKKLLDTNNDLQEKIRRNFGDDLYLNDTLNKKAFASLIFANEDKIRLANSIIHPFVFEDFNQWCDQNIHHNIVFMEAAILFESGGWKNMDKIILVYAPESIRLKRVMERDKLTEDQVRERMNHQLPDEIKRTNSHHILDNSGEQALLPQVLDLWIKLNG